MPTTSIRVPKFMDPRQESVFESSGEKLLRLIARLIGSSDPESIVDDVAGMTTPIGFGSVLGKNAFRHMGRRANLSLPDLPVGRMPFGDQRFPVEISVQVRWPDGMTHHDTVKGLNIGHALRRAASNWPGAAEVKVLAAQGGDDVIGDLTRIHD